MIERLPHPRSTPPQIRSLIPDHGKLSGIVWINRFLRVGLTTWNLTPSMKLSPFRALSCCKSLRNFACRLRCFRDLLYSHRKVMTFLLAACSPSLLILSRSDNLFRSCSRRSLSYGMIGVRAVSQGARDHGRSEAAAHFGAEQNRAAIRY